MQRVHKDAPSPNDLAAVCQVSDRLVVLQGEMNEIFPEREFMLEQLVYALLTKEHQLAFGTYGTGKSDLLETLFSAITGARIFSIGMTKFMPEGYLVGAADPNVLRDKGQFFHRREGTLIDAHFADLDEFFDANPALQRVLLGILNERKFERGSQSEQAVLQSAVASTNASPDTEVAKNRELGAVVDRFLFHAKVDYLVKRENRLRMYLHYLHGDSPKTQITLQELMLVSDIVVQANQITDNAFLAIYEDMMQAYVERIKSLNKLVISDRRRCRILQVVEAEALRRGRFDVVLDDLYATRFALCVAGDEQTYKAFDEAAKPVIEKAKTEAAQNVDKVQVELLLAYRADIPTIPAQCSDGDLVTLMRQLTALRVKVDGVKPQTKTTSDQKTNLLGLVDKSIQTVDQRIKA